METIGRPETAKSLQNPKPQPEAGIHDPPCLQVVASEESSSLTVQHLRMGSGSD